MPTSMPEISVESPRRPDGNPPITSLSKRPRH
jgi:hypothetical protein